jgi:hypothetical protein
MSPADYVIDFLRCTIQVEDPYVVAVLFEVFKLAKIATCLRTCRVKNNFTDKKLPRHIQTNALMNLQLLYPSTAEEFVESGMLGEFDGSMAGKCIMVCELQITMKDFLQIKRLQHSYSSLTRVGRNDLAAFLLENGPFIDPNTLEEKIPSVVKEMASQEKRLSIELEPTASAIAEEVVAAAVAAAVAAVAADASAPAGEINKQLDDQVPEVKALEDENAELKLSQAKLKEELDGRDSSVKALADENMKLKLSEDEMKKQLDGRDSAIKALGEENAELKLSRERLKQQLEGKEAAVIHALEDENAELRRKLQDWAAEAAKAPAPQDSSFLLPLPQVPLPTVDVDGLVSSLPPNPFTAASSPALAVRDEERARRLFQLALAKGRKSWGLHEAPKDINRPAFVELIQKLIAVEHDGVAAAASGGEAEQQQTPPPSAEEIGAVFDKADVDSNGTVSEDEFIALFSEVKAGHSPNFLGGALFGVDGSGFDFGLGLEDWTSGIVG